MGQCVTVSVGNRGQTVIPNASSPISINNKQEDDDEEDEEDEETNCFDESCFPCI